MRNKLTLVLLIITYSSCISNAQTDSTKTIPRNWESINDLQGKWDQIERDTTGYLFHNPCDGRTPGIIISKDSLTLIHQLEEPTIVAIDKVSITKDSITINTNSEIQTAEFIFKIVGPNANHILLKWNYPKYQNKGKQVITREELSKDLRKIDHPCKNEKVPEYKFLPVEYD